MRDSLGRLVELPVDTHPGHYRKDTGTIHSAAVVRLKTPLRSIPPGGFTGVPGHWLPAQVLLAWGLLPGIEQVL